MKKLTPKEEARRLTILDSLINWQDNPAQALEPFSMTFPKCKGFKFGYEHLQETNITVYFGLILSLKSKPKVVMQVIPEYEDETELAFTHVSTYATLTSLNYSFLISNAEAYKRIKRWRKDSVSWVEKHQSNLFKAISIPSTDFAEGWNFFTVYFALKEGENTGEEQAVQDLDFDLVLYRDSDHVFLDTVHLIPPYKLNKSYVLSQVPLMAAL